MRSEWRGPESRHGSDDYANVPLSGGQVATAGMAGFDRAYPDEMIEAQPQSAVLSQQGAPGKYTELGYAPQPYRVCNHYTTRVL